ncbi:hypothetical protein BGZ76_003243, partial [Entomortierella beljakovae]
LTNTDELFVRQGFKDLYDYIIRWIRLDKAFVVTGTAGIGKSSFLIYLAIRLLASSTNECPPVIIFQVKEKTSEYYALGGFETVRCGKLDDFKLFLDLPETWHLVDSSPEPILRKARTIFSVSPNTLNFQGYRDVTKQVENTTWIRGL